MKYNKIMGKKKIRKCSLCSIPAKIKCQDCDKVYYCSDDCKELELGYHKTICEGMIEKKKKQDEEQQEKNRNDKEDEDRQFWKDLREREERLQQEYGMTERFSQGEYTQDTYEPQLLDWRSENFVKELLIDSLHEHIPLRFAMPTPKSNVPFKTWHLRPDMPTPK
jgi:hypothetical protein